MISATPRKFAKSLCNMARILGRELAADKVRVNCVCPGHVRTDMAAQTHETLPEEQYKALMSRHALGMGTPEDVAYAIAFLLAPAAKWITCTALVIDGGYSA